MPFNVRYVSEDVPHYSPLLLLLMHSRDYLCLHCANNTSFHVLNAPWWANVAATHWD